jgi:endoglucanase
MNIKGLDLFILTRRFLFSIILSGIFFISYAQTDVNSFPLKLNDLGYFESPGINVMVFSNWYNGVFGDSKMSGIEIIHHEVRTATNGDVRISLTPGQWDPIPEFVERKVNKEKNMIEAFLKYPDYNFEYSIKAEGYNEGILLSVNLNNPLPEKLEGKAGFNLEFLPSAYFEKAYQMDNNSGIFPLYPGGPMEITSDGKVEPKPISTGKTLVLAPEDPSRRITIKTTENSLSLYDGRNKAQNGWFVVRSLIPSGKTGKVVEWFLTASSIPGWIRSPMIAYSQVGYHPDQKKTAVIELDRNDTRQYSARLLRVNADGKFTEQYSASPVTWGKYLRYNYVTFDFSSVIENGIYIIEYGDIRTFPFKISEDVYDNAWQPTLDVFFPIQMDHMFVNEAYRVWHGASHMDDALQAPVNHDHFDMYAQGPTTDTRYKSGEHIPGLNIGGWYDAGDFDIRTQTQYAVVLSLVQIWETFQIERDETTIDQEKRYVDIHVPDGKPDLLQQIEHGTLALMAQHKAVGHAINGIIAPTLSQYTHLGDAVTATDNLIYYSGLDAGRSDGFNSGTFDDRWAFTSKSTPLNYGSAAALAAASRALKGYNDALSRECLSMAEKVWEEEHSHDPDLFTHGNTTGGGLKEEELKAAVELLICTEDGQYAKKINELWPFIENRFSLVAISAVRAIPFMDEQYSGKLKNLVIKYKAQNEQLLKDNPFGVPIVRGGWAGSGWAIGFAITNYYLHLFYPDIISPDNTFKGLEYIFGCHPGSNISFVSGVGTNSKKVAYGNNRADFSFIAGGIVPGILILPPDFPENKEDWPFLWGENEYVINVGSSYIFLVNAVKDLLN